MSRDEVAVRGSRRRGCHSRTARSAGFRSLQYPLWRKCGTWPVARHERPGRCLEN
ncbi:uncharacterized protein STEHIDRAFT_121020 [Stereum hirsutum FP-91666 SS1]|uniref:uncharacterized protein n=1 Tax=Stereum hirsutum (strain FP-91666) TaxID=721885 RepID=UPI000440C8EC|nr:uncharacterized protein STEHIDRAFT_121020 [Stereum hirsutum FP-91666 SS1]EIM87383.1 hypothetical protein STEHIDRAFT_121020 [Stereum hirsutum FP-91666 SS1]